jgi:hypothetical protein
VIAALPMRGEKDTADQLRELLAEHKLSQREASELACVSLKTVESWLAPKGAANHRTMHPRHLHMIRHMLPGFLAAKRGREGKK